MSDQLEEGSTTEGHDDILRCVQ